MLKKLKDFCFALGVFSLVAVPVLIPAAVSADIAGQPLLPASPCYNQCRNYLLRPHWLAEEPDYRSRGETPCQKIDYGGGEDGYN